MAELVIPDPPPFHRVKRIKVLRHLPIVEMRLRWPDPIPWLLGLTWDFPTWSVRNRPFDWAEDEADIPPPPPPPSWSVPERRQFDLYLRPAEAVVRR